MNLQYSVGSLTDYNTITLTNCKSKISNGGLYYPIIDASYSAYTSLVLTSSDLVYIDCSYSSNCAMSFSSSTLSTSSSELITPVFCDSSSNCGISFTNFHAGYIDCSSSSDCTGSFDQTITTYSAGTCTTSSIINYMNCKYTATSCSMACSNSEFCQLDCTGS